MVVGEVVRGVVHTEVEGVAHEEVLGEALEEVHRSGEEEVPWVDQVEEVEVHVVVQEGVPLEVHRSRTLVWGVEEVEGEALAYNCIGTEEGVVVGPYNRNVPKLSAPQQKPLGRAPTAR